jgi:hypothetical protein
VALEQMKLLLTLLLGAAVQCPNKELFIARIKELDVDTQHSLVELIKQVTDSQTLVLTPDFNENVPREKILDHVVRLAKERNKFQSSWITSLTNLEQHDGIMGHQKESSNITSPVSSSSASVTTESNHMAVELADLKSKMRRVRQELEDKSESLLETKEELEHTRNQYEKLKMESQEWYTEARKSK